MYSAKLTQNGKFLHLSTIGHHSSLDFIIYFRLRTGIFLYKHFPPPHPYSLLILPSHIQKKNLKNTQRLFLFLCQMLSFEDFTIYRWSGGKTEFSKMQTFLKRPVSPLAAPASNDLPTESISV